VAQLGRVGGVGWRGGGNAATRQRGNAAAVSGESCATTARVWSPEQQSDIACRITFVAVRLLCSLFVIRRSSFFAMSATSFAVAVVAGHRSLVPPSPATQHEVNVQTASDS